MGMQQILLIVLSVIIVGVAIAVGITMFSTQAVNANRQALANDLNNFAASAMAFYKTPTSMGGGGRSFIPDGSTDNLYKWLGFGADGTFSNDNGSYSLEYGTAPAEHVIYITGLGTEKVDDTHNVGAQIELDMTDASPITFTIKDDIGTSLT